MRLLLDTHTLLWFALNDPQLSATATSLILDPAYENLVSPASYWEIAIKISTKKYILASPYEDFFRGAIDDYGFRVLTLDRATPHGRSDHDALSPQRPIRPHDHTTRWLKTPRW